MISTDPTEAALMAAVCAAPHDDEPRLAYADWAARAGGAEGIARADYIRRTIRRYRDQQELDDDTALRLRTPARTAAWANGVDRLELLHHDFVRGFVGYVLADAAPLLRADVATRCPVEYVCVRRGAKAELANLLRAPWMTQFMSLDLGKNDLTDDDVHRIAASDLRGLRWLNLDGNPVSFGAVEALAAATAIGHFPELHSLLLPFDIYDEVEGGRGMTPIQLTVFRPEAGTRLRATYGDLPWLTPRPPGLRSALYA